MPSVKTLVTKPEADAVCEEMGAHVVAIEKADEDDFITSLVFSSSGIKKIFLNIYRVIVLTLTNKSMRHCDDPYYDITQVQMCFIMKLLV